MREVRFLYFDMSYNKLIAGEWDKLIDWELRQATDLPWLLRFLTGASIERILDTATGTGFHAVMLARAGFTVEAWDRSAAMLMIARRNAAEHGVRVRFFQRAWLSKQPPPHKELFEAIVCLGNSLSHILSRRQRRRVLTRWRDLLTSSGYLIVDVRNFQGIMDSPHSQARFCYLGPASIDVAAASASHIELTYEVGALKFRLSYGSLTPASLREEAESVGLRHVATYGNGEAAYDSETVSFYQLIFSR